LFENNVTTPELILAGAMNPTILASTTCDLKGLDAGHYYLCLRKLAVHLLSGGQAPTNYWSLIEISECETKHKAQQMWEAMEYIAKVITLYRKDLFN